MDMRAFFEEILNQYGLFTTVAIVALMYVLKDLWGRFSTKLFRKKTIALRDNAAFKDLDRIIEHHLVDNFNCPCPIRKALYRDILIERMKCFRKSLFEFAQTDVNSKELYPTQHDFYLKIASIIDSAHAESKRNSMANGIPEFVLDSLDDHWKQMRTVLGDMLKYICHSEYTYSSNIDRMQQILPFIVVFCKNYMDMLEGILAQYNGEIRNLEYKGVSCRHCKVCIHDEYIRMKKASLK